MGRISSKKKHFLGPQKLRCAGPKTQNLHSDEKPDRHNKCDFEKRVWAFVLHGDYMASAQDLRRLTKTRDVSNHKPFVLFCYKIQNLKFQKKKKKNLKFKKKKKKKKKK